MQNILIIINAPPYGSERCLSALRLATALAGNDAKPAIRIFLMSDATYSGCRIRLMVLVTACRAWSNNWSGRASIFACAEPVRWPAALAICH
jgi:sulfur relay (sulfurtransferase) complex TusBCD TusD component (DsrE family)